jgi:hypothetical protein
MVLVEALKGNTSWVADSSCSQNSQCEEDEAEEEEEDRQSVEVNE